MALVELGRLLFQVREHVVAQVELDLARGADDDLAGEIEADRGDDGNADQAQRVTLDGRDGEVMLNVAHGLANQQREDGLCGIVDDQRQTAEQKAAPVTAQIREERAEALEHGFL